MKRTLVALALTLSSAAGVGAVVTNAEAAGCSVTWGSAAKHATSSTHATLTGVRAGRHTCYDRLVLDRTRAGTGWSVRYVSTVHREGSGAALPLRGGAFLEVVDQSQVTHRLAMPSVAGFTTFRQVADGGSFEGYTTIGLGVRARLPFRVTTSGNSLVIDVAHYW
jgi:hypothetical protein